MALPTSTHLSFLGHTIHTTPPFGTNASTQLHLPPTQGFFQQHKAQPWGSTYCCLLGGASQPSFLFLASSVWLGLTTLRPKASLSLWLHPLLSPESQAFTFPTSLAAMGG
jgi:hypothetical protein